MECNRSHVRMIASHVFLINLWSAIVRTCERLQAFLIFNLIFGVQSFVRANDCKSSHISFLDCNRSHV